MGLWRGPPHWQSDRRLIDDKRTLAHDLVCALHTGISQGNRIKEQPTVQSIIQAIVTLNARDTTDCLCYPGGRTPRMYHLAAWYWADDQQSLDLLKQALMSCLAGCGDLLTISQFQAVFRRLTFDGLRLVHTRAPEEEVYAEYAWPEDDPFMQADLDLVRSYFYDIVQEMDALIESTLRAWPVVCNLRDMSTMVREDGYYLWTWKGYWDVCATRAGIDRSCPQLFRRSAEVNMGDYTRSLPDRVLESSGSDCDWGC